ncbi:MAG: hypothetical protein HYR84_13230 [Planctomycetes bacterium]|nr:hypothetical protein [Planctomycetota bacterium]
MPPFKEQRNPYAGSPPRPWFFVRLAAEDGNTREFKLIADTGNPFAIVIDCKSLNIFNDGEGPPVDTNFGPLEGAWFKLAMPEFCLTQRVFGCGSDEIVAGAKANHPDFEGLAGLPLLRCLEYGGNADGFWIRRSTSSTA